MHPFKKPFWLFPSKLCTSNSLCLSIATLVIALRLILSCIVFELSERSSHASFAVTSITLYSSATSSYSIRWLGIMFSESSTIFPPANLKFFSNIETPCICASTISVSRLAMFICLNDSIRYSFKASSSPDISPSSPSAFIAERSFPTTASLRVWHTPPMCRSSLRM